LGLLKEGDEFCQLTSPALEHAALRVREGREIGGEDLFEALLDLIEAGLEGTARFSTRELCGRCRTAGIPQEVLVGWGVGRGTVGGEEGLGLPVSEGVTTNGFGQAHLLALSKGAQVKRDGQGWHPAG